MLFGKKDDNNTKNVDSKNIKGSKSKLTEKENKPQKDDKKSNTSKVEKKNPFISNKKDDGLEKLVETKEQNESKPYIPYNNYGYWLNKKTVIFFVIEDTVDVKKYANQINAITKRIIKENDSELFSFMVPNGKDTQINLLSASLIERDKTVESILKSDDKTEISVKLLDPLRNIAYFLEYVKKSFGKIYRGKSEFYVEKCKIIFIGTGEYEKNLQQDVTELIKFINNQTLVKTMKYFCMKDSQTVNAAKLGFPVIGHIEYDFYK